MGVNQDSALFAECKWTNEKVNLGVLDTLIERSDIFSFREKHFYVFAKSGFTRGCMDKAEEMKNVTLVAYEDLLEQSKPR